MSNFVVQKMVGKTEKFFCFYCKKDFLKKINAEKCVKEHELILVPIAKEDLGRLNQFLYSKEDKLLTQSLVEILRKYAREAARRI